MGHQHCAHGLYAAWPVFSFTTDLKGTAPLLHAKLRDFSWIILWLHIFRIPKIVKPSSYSPVQAFFSWRYNFFDFTVEKLKLKGTNLYITNKLFSKKVNNCLVSGWWSLTGRRLESRLFEPEKETADFLCTNAAILKFAAITLGQFAMKHKYNNFTSTVFKEDIKT